MKTLGILGTGLLGASIGMRARERGYHVAGHDASEEALAIAKDRSAIDIVVPRDEVYACDITMIALPVEATIEELKRKAALCSDSAGCIMDVASMKLPIAKAAAGIHNFVTTHPFAGRERSGAAAADATLFDEKSWVYVSSGNAELDKRVEEFIREMGSIPYVVDAKQHDAIVACTSHLPQLLAWLFADRYAEEEPQLIEALSGPVARELQRIARSERPMWREIFRANAANLSHEARAIAKQLETAADALERNEEIV